MIGTKASYSVLERLEQAGYEAVYVGGAVRDYVRNERPKDIDIATSATPDEVEALFPKTVPVGKEHGTILVLEKGEQLEVTTYRTESDYIDYRRPKEVQFVRSLEDDLLRRDFTMNAMALTKEGELIDPFGGQSDIRLGIIRAVGEPSARFEEDALRMMRAFRFIARFGYQLEEKTALAIQEKKSLFQHIARERMKEEFDKWAIAPYEKRAWQEAEMLGFIDVLPVFANGQIHTNYPNPIIAQCPMERWVTWAHYFQVSLLQLGHAYKWSNEEKKLAKSVQQLAMKRSLPTRYDLYLYDEQIVSIVQSWRAYEGEDYLTTREIQQLQKQLPIRAKQDLAMTGRNVMAFLNRKGGPWLGQLLDEMERAVVEGNVENDPEQLKEWIRRRDDER